METSYTHASGSSSIRSISRRRPSTRSRSSRSRAASSHSARSDSSTISSKIDWGSGDAYDYVQSDHQISAFLQCPICLGPFYDPHVSDQCSHTFCKQCITTALSEDGNHLSQPLSSSSKCPSCRTPVRLDQFKPTALLIKNMVDTLQVQCPNKAIGCQHVCERHLLKGHVSKVCEFEYVDQELNQGKRCGCNEKVMRKDWATHGLSCPKRKTKCPICQLELEFDQIKQHSQECSPEPASCEFCTLELTVGTLPHHYDLCPLFPVLCVHAEYGCTWKGPRCQLQPPSSSTDHLLIESSLADASLFHLTVCPFEPLKAFFVNFTQQNLTLSAENAALRRRLDELESKQRSHDRRLDDCVHSLGSWYRSAGQSIPLESVRSRSSEDELASDWQQALALISMQTRQTRNLSSRSSHSHNSGMRAEENATAEGLDTLGMSSRAFHSTSPFSSSGLGPLLSSSSLPPTMEPSNRLARAATGRLGVLLGESRSSSSVSPIQVPLSSGQLAETVQRHSSTEGLREPPIPIDLFDLAELEATVRNDQTSLDDLLRSLQSSVIALTNGLANLERRSEESHLTAVNAGFEAGRAQEEVGSLRHGLHAVRMQSHQILMQQQRHALFLPPVFSQAHSMLNHSVDGPQTAFRRNNEGGNSTSVTNHVTAPIPPNLLSLASVVRPINEPPTPPLLRRWTGFDQTKL